MVVVIRGRWLSNADLVLIVAHLGLGSGVLVVLRGGVSSVWGYSLCRLGESSMSHHANVRKFWYIDDI